MPVTPILDLLFPPLSIYSEYHTFVVRLFILTIFLAAVSPVVYLTSFLSTWYPAVSLAGRLSLILADIVVLIVTWMKTFSDVRQATVFRLPSGLPGTLLRDGECTVSEKGYLIEVSCRKHILHVCGILHDPKLIAFS